MAKDVISKMLHSYGMRSTPGRKRVLQILLKAGRPLSAKDVIQELGSYEMDRVSVYRTLNSFVEKGFVHRAFLEQRTWSFELADRCTGKHCHAHFTCSACGMTTCLDDVFLPLANIAEKGYVLKRQRVQLQGICPSCNNERSASSSTGLKSH